MRTLLILLTLALVTPAAVGLSLSGPTAGSTACTDPLEHDWFDTPAVLNDPLFARLFPGMDLVQINERSRLPEIPRFFAQGTAGVCSLDDLPALLATTDRVLANDGDLKAAAWLLAQTTDEEVMGVQRLVGFDGYTPTADGAIVTLTAKSPATGTVVAWVVDIARDGHGTATWTVRSIEPGLRERFEGWFIGPGDTGPAGGDDIGTLAVQTKLYPTHDGKSIRITYDTNNYVDLAAAELDADRNGNAGVLAYDTINRDWVFPSADPDPFLDITVDGCACIYSGNNVDIHMPPNLLQWIQDIGLGLDYPSASGVVNLVVAHEFFHHFQYSIMQWNQGGWVIEGTARFSETIFHPQETHHPESLTYHMSINGFSWLMANPAVSPQAHAYSYGLAWGHIYDRNGGVDVIRSILEESAADAAFPGFVDRALAAAPGDHDTFGAALADLGPRMLTKSFAWSTWDGSASYDWGDFLPNVYQQKLTPSPTQGYWNRLITPFALAFVDLSTPGSTDPFAAVAVAGGVGLEYYFVTNGASTPILGAHVDDTNTDKHIFVLFNPPVVAPNSLVNNLMLAPATVAGTTQ